MRNSIKTILDESSGDKKRNFVETVCRMPLACAAWRAAWSRLDDELTPRTLPRCAHQIELQIGLKNYDPQRDKRFSGTIK